MKETPTGAERSAEIHFRVDLNERQLPVRIQWSATDAPEGDVRETKSFLLSVWDGEQKRAMCIDLWTKDMLVDEMRISSSRRSSPWRTPWSGPRPSARWRTGSGGWPIDSQTSSTRRAGPVRDRPDPRRRRCVKMSPYE